MRFGGFIALIGVLGAAACGESAPHAYPDAALSRFEATCPSQRPVCRCTWEQLTRTLTYEEYEEALARFQETGLMDPRVTRARTRCLERHRD